MGQSAIQFTSYRTYRGAVVGVANPQGIPGKNVNTWYVDTVNGSDSSGRGTPYSPWATMGKAFDNLVSNDVIYFKGKVREQLVAPLGVTGVSIIGAVTGNVRDDDGAKWYAPASPVAGKALIEIREQGWTFENFLMTPDNTGGAAIKAHRAEDASYPDSSHFICRGMRFVGAGGTPIGIEDVGGNHHYIVDGCEFQTLTSAIVCTSTAIAVPLRNTIINNKFMGNTNDIKTSLSYSLIQGNVFFTPGNGATNKVVSTVANSGQGGNNVVRLNQFNNPAAEIVAAEGYSGASTDLWINYVNDQAALVVGQPTP